MNCTICKANKIGPEIKPFGGYLCNNDHLQCAECNAFTDGYCGACKATTKFLQMKFDSPRSPLDPLHSLTQSASPQGVSHKEKSSHSAFFKKLFAEIETQSRLSEEQLSMKDSREYIIGSNKYVDKKLETQAFIGAENSAYISDIRSDLHVNGKSLSADQFSHFENNKLSHFSFKEDPNESNIVNVSEIRFMDSSDSFPNIFANTKHEDLATVPLSNGEQRTALSSRVLVDFDARNTVNSTEAVHNYLETYSPTTFHLSPVYNCQRSNCHLALQQRKQDLELEMTAEGVSNESDAGLKSTYLEAKDQNVSATSKPPDYFIMQAIGVPPAPHSLNITADKSDNKQSMDMRMQKILQTLREDTKVTKFDEKSNIIKIPAPVKVKEEEKEQVENRNFKNEDKTSEHIEELINTHRAYCNPPKPLTSPANNLLHAAQQEPPLPQFQTVPCSKALAQELLQKLKSYSKIKSVPACLLNIPRSPIKCPESSCQRMIFVSDFCKHLVVDHTQLPMERIAPFQYKNFFLDARLFRCSSSKCHLLYLICDKINDLGSSEYKDFLPILVMTSRLSLNQMCGIASQTSSLEYFLIWITGMAPAEIPISVSLTVWSRAGRIPSCHAVYSGQLYSIRNSQNAIDVWQSGHMLLLSSQQVETLTNSGKEMLNVQLSVH